MTQQFAARDGRRSAHPSPTPQRVPAAAASRLVQLAEALGKSPRTHMLVQRKATLQRPTPLQLSGRGQPVIQRKSEVKYKTQSVGYEDAKGDMQTETVGKVADAWIDVADPITGTAPDSSKQQKAMYSRLKSTYSQGFIRGHLLNDNLGGVGEVYNLFPITSSANGEHKVTAEGKLKANTRKEIEAKQQGKKGPFFVHYRVTAVPDNGANLTEDADAVFRCEMVAAHSLLEGGKNEVWTVFSQPQKKPKAEGPRSSKTDFSNQKLGPFKSSGTGEHTSTLISRMRSTVDGWRGDKNFKFASKGIGSHLSLVEQKQQALKQLETQLEDHPLYDEFYFDALERAETLLAEVHDPSGIPTALQKLDRILQRWVLQRRKWRLLQTLRESLTDVAVSDTIKTDMFNFAEREFKPIVDLTALEQTWLRITTAMGNQINLLLQQQQPPQLNPN
ncbi:MAG: hypothetical protein EOP58_03465 [Sphingomonadales bacterium]|nr:MAG: hypothetical protein EOP58_03465 [Sphingomonadales bacterium]